MAIYSVYVINKAGSLIYHQAFGSTPKLPTNETIFLASMFHGYVTYRAMRFVLAGRIRACGMRTHFLAAGAAHAEPQSFSLTPVSLQLAQVVRHHCQGIAHEAVGGHGGP